MFGFAKVVSINYADSQLHNNSITASKASNSAQEVTKPRVSSIQKSIATRIAGSKTAGAKKSKKSALSNDKQLSDDDIDAILRKGEERTAELNKKYEKLGIDDLQKFSSESAYEWNGKDFTEKKKDIGNMQVIHHARSAM